MPESKTAAGPETPREVPPPPLWRRLARSRLRLPLAVVAGAAAGAAYSHFIGCRTGTCPITSNVWIASLYGAFVGGLAGWPPRAEAATPAGPPRGPVTPGR